MRHRFLGNTLAWLPLVLALTVMFSIVGCNDDAGGTGSGPSDTESYRDFPSFPGDVATVDTAGPSNDVADTGADSQNETDMNAAGDSTDVPSGGDLVEDSGAGDTSSDAPLANDTAQDTGADASSMFCSDKLRAMYVMDKNGTLYSFLPTQATFVEVGPVDTGDWLNPTPGSMAVSRDATTIINYSNSELYSVDISDATCSATSWVAGTGGYDRFGMGFVYNAVSGEDVLYIASADRLAALDTTTWTLSDVGPLPSQCELTGNALGELWGFFPLESPPKLRQLDRTDASVIASYSLPPLPADLDTFAFSYWGGNFFLFYRVHGMGSSTSVYRYSLTDGLQPLVLDTGRNIVGAGVSTCVPTSN